MPIRERHIISHSRFEDEMKQCVSRDWHGVWSLSVSVKCSLNTIKLKQAPRYCCELAERWTVCYAFSNSTDPKAKLFSSKPLLPMFFTSHLVARCRSLEAAQETSILVPPPEHTQTHLRGHHVTQSPSRQHLPDPARPVRHHLCCAPRASLLLPSTAAPCTSPCLQPCFFTHLLQGDHLPMQTGRLLR